MTDSLVRLVEKLKQAQVALLVAGPSVEMQTMRRNQLADAASNLPVYVLEAAVKLAEAIDKHGGPSPEAYDVLMEFRAAKQKGV